MPIRLAITAKGQVTLPKAVLEHLGAKPSQQLCATFLPDGRVELRAAGAAPSVTRARGALHRERTEPVSLAEMQNAIERSAGGPG